MNLPNLLMLAPLLLYLLHALWRVIASNQLISTLCVLSGYLVTALLFRLCLPTLPLLPVWLPLLYGYLWLGIAGVLAILACGHWQRQGLALQGLSRRMGCYFIAQSSLLLGMLLLSPLLAGRPLQALATLPPLVAAGGMGAYLALLRASRDKVCTPWWAIGFVLVLLPLMFGWIAEIIVPVLLRYL